MLYPKKNVRTNYVICCWSGQRRVMDHRYIQDRTYYLKNHIKCLLDYHHELNRITFAVSYNKIEPPSYREILENLPERIKEAEVVVLDRQNKGMSYGAISDVFKQEMDAFDYYFIAEDDGVFCIDGFDKFFTNFMEKNKKCGYACAVAGINKMLPEAGHHAMISSGCYKTQALLDLMRINGGTIWPYPYKAYTPPGEQYWAAEEFGQINISKALMMLGYEVRDLGHRYRSGFRLPDGKIRWFYPANKEKIFMPI